MIKKEIELYDGIIIGLKDYSVNLPIYFSIQEIKEITKYVKENQKEIFISLNKNLHNEDIEPIKNILLELDILEVTGILYYDIGIVNIKNKQDLKTPLVWSQEHLTTNADACNYWKNFGAPYTYLSSELTQKEILQIRTQTDNKLLVNILGYLPMFHSKRHLVKNYLNHFGLKNDNKEQYYIKKEGKTYPIIDDNLGTTVYSSLILNAIEESFILKENNIDYAVLNSYHIEESAFHQILSLYKNINIENKQETIEQINTILKDKYDKGFFYKETIYKVKGGNA